MSGGVQTRQFELTTVLLHAHGLQELGASVSTEERMAVQPGVAEQTSTAVWIFDPHPIVRAGIRSQLAGSGFVVAAEAAHPADAAARQETCTPPRLVILDASFGTAAIADIKRRYADAQVVVFAENAEISSLSAAFEAGADGYMLKSISAPALLDSLRLVLHGEKVFPSTLTCFLSAYRRAPADMPGGDCRVGNVLLSDREMGILRGLAQGHTNKRIANALNITEATVKVNLKAVLRKLDMSNRTQVAIWAVQNRLHADGAVVPDSQIIVHVPKVEALQ
jgi:two-component system nitrate/nitrite response regulator NarL